MSKQLRTPRHRALRAAVAATRIMVGMTQRDLAKKIKRSPSFVAKIENGELQLRVLEFCEIAEALGVDPRDLLGKILE